MEDIFSDIRYFVKGKTDNRQQISLTSIKEQGILIIGLYFSSYKCIPCHKFLPKLTSWYSKLNTIVYNKFEIVFIEVNCSTLRDYNVLFDTMPWLGLSYEDLFYAKTLSTKYRVNGTPCLILINPITGNTISYNACDYIDTYPNGEEFPWPDISLTNILEGQYITRNNEVSIPKLTEWNIEDIMKHKIIALYFTDMDLQDTETLTAQITNLCTKVNKREPSINLQIVYTLYCENAYDFTQKIKSLPANWLALPFDSSKQRSSLVDLYSVTVFPSFILLDTTQDKIIRRNAEELVKIDPEGKDFPWPTKLVEVFDSGCSDIIQESPGVMWFTDGSLEQIRHAINTMLPIATKEHTAAGSSNTPAKLWFYVANSSDEMTSDLLEIIDISEQDYPILSILDFGDQTKYVCETKDIDEKTLANFVSNFKGGQLIGTDMNL